MLVFNLVLVRKITSINEVNPSQWMERVSYSCEKCGITVEKTVRAILLRPQLLCRKHLLEVHLTDEIKRTAKERRETTNLAKYGYKSNFSSPEFIEENKTNRRAKFGEAWTNLPKFHSTCLERYGVRSPWAQRFNIEAIARKRSERAALKRQKQLEEKQRKALLKKMLKLLKFRIKQLNKKPYSKHIGSTEIRSKIETSMIERYGVSNYMLTDDFKKAKEAFWSSEENVINAARKISKTLSSKTPEELREIAMKRSKRYEVNDMKLDSSWEVAFVETHPDCKRGPCIETEFGHWFIDFEWNGNLYEVKNPWTLTPDYPWGNKDKLKFAISEELDVRWYLWKPGSLSIDEEELAYRIVKPGELEKFFGF
jgi:hypothetical protein